MTSEEIKKSKANYIKNMIDYIPDTVAIKILIPKVTGNIRVMAFDSGKSITEEISPFDTFIHVIEGKAEIIIDKVSNVLNTGMSAIIPAFSHNIIKANGRFKMLSTIIKNECDN